MKFSALALPSLVRGENDDFPGFQEAGKRLGNELRFVGLRRDRGKAVVCLVVGALLGLAKKRYEALYLRFLAHRLRPP